MCGHGNRERKGKRESEREVWGVRVQHGLAWGECAAEQIGLSVHVR